MQLIGKIGDVHKIALASGVTVTAIDLSYILTSTERYC